MHDNDPKVVMAPQADGWTCSDLFRRLLVNLAEGREKEINYLVHWLAWRLQHHDQKALAALILRGAQGTGKGLLAKVLSKIYGRYLAHIDGSSIESAFNQFMFEKLLVIANEVGNSFFADKRRAATRLKGWVVGDDITVNMKYVNPFKVKNFTAWILCSNDVTPVTFDLDDRRYNVIASQWTLREHDPGLAAALVAALDGPTFVQEVVDYLGSVILDGFDQTASLENEARREVMGASMRSNERWWREECPPDGFYTAKVLYRAYEQWAIENGEHKVTTTMFGRNLPKGVEHTERRFSSTPGLRRAIDQDSAVKGVIYTIARGVSGPWPYLDMGFAPVAANHAGKNGNGTTHETHGVSND